MAIDSKPDKVTLYGTFTATGQSDSVELPAGTYIVLLQGGTATIVLQRYNKAQAQWEDVADGSFSLAGDTANKIGTEPVGATYRFNCTAYTSSADYTLEARV